MGCTFAEHYTPLSLPPSLCPAVPPSSGGSDKLGPLGKPIRRTNTFRCAQRAALTGLAPADLLRGVPALSYSVTICLGGACVRGLSSAPAVPLCSLHPPSTIPPCSSSLAVLQEHHTEGGRGGEELAPAPQGPGLGSGHGSGGARWRAGGGREGLGEGGLAGSIES